VPAQRSDHKTHLSPTVFFFVVVCLFDFGFGFVFVFVFVFLIKIKNNPPVRILVKREKEN